MTARDERALRMVSDAVQDELRGALNLVDFDADVTVRQPHSPIYMSRSDSVSEIMARVGRDLGGPTVVVELGLQDAGLLALALYEWRRDEPHASPSRQRWRRWRTRVQSRTVTRAQVVYVLVVLAILGVIAYGIAHKQPFPVRSEVQPGAVHDPRPCSTCSG